MRLRPSVPRSARTVRAAVRLMYAGTALSTLNLIIADHRCWPSIDDIKVYHVRCGDGISSPWPSPAHLDSLAAWSRSPCGCGWLGRTASAGTGHATRPRCCSAWRRWTSASPSAIPVVQLRLVPVIFGPAILVLTWLIGLAAVWLLCIPASTAFFQPHGLTQPGTSHRRLPALIVQFVAIAPVVSRAHLPAREVQAGLSVRAIQPSASTTATPGRHQPARADPEGWRRRLVQPDE